MLSKVSPELGIKLRVDVFPTSKEINEMLTQLSPDPIDPSLAVLDPLIAPPSTFSSKSAFSQPQLYDSRGFSSYARVVDALLQVFGEDRQLAKQNTWALGHFLALGVYAQDLVSVPSAWSPAFEQKALAARLDDVIARVRRVTTYVLTSAADDGWRGAALDIVLEAKGVGHVGTLPALLVDAIKEGQQHDLMRDVRVLRVILDHVFHDLEKDEADRSIVLARKIELTG